MRLLVAVLLLSSSPLGFPRPKACDALCTDVLDVIESRADGFASIRGEAATDTYAKTTKKIGDAGCSVRTATDLPRSVDCQVSGAQSLKEGLATFDREVKALRSILPKSLRTPKREEHLEEWAGRGWAVRVQLSNMAVLMGEEDGRTSKNWQVTLSVVAVPDTEPAPEDEPHSR